MTKTDTFNVPEHGFTCFHCGDTFHTVKSAREHFGNDINDEPGCVLKLMGGDKGLLGLVRLQYAKLDQYRMEDQPIMRELYSLGAKHSRELIEAEQKGYDRGLSDGRIYLSRQPLPPEIVAEIEEELLTRPEREVARRRGISHGRIRGVSRSMKKRAAA